MARKILADTPFWAEAMAIKDGYDKLEQSQGTKKRATLKRKGLRFQVWG